MLDALSFGDLVKQTATNQGLVLETLWYHENVDGHNVWSKLDIGSGRRLQVQAEPPAWVEILASATACRKLNISEGDQAMYSLLGKCEKCPNCGGQVGCDLCRWSAQFGGHRGFVSRHQLRDRPVPENLTPIDDGGQADASFRRRNAEQRLERDARKSLVAAEMARLRKGRAQR